MNPVHLEFVREVVLKLNNPIADELLTKKAIKNLILLGAREGTTQIAHYALDPEDKIPLELDLIRNHRLLAPLVPAMDSGDLEPEAVFRDDWLYQLSPEIRTKDDLIEATADIVCFWRDPWCFVLPAFWEGSVETLRVEEIEALLVSAFDGDGWILVELEG